MALFYFQEMSETYAMASKRIERQLKELSKMREAIEGVASTARIETEADRQGKKKMKVPAPRLRVCKRTRALRLKRPWEVKIIDRNWQLEPRGIPLARFRTEGEALTYMRQMEVALTIWKKPPGQEHAPIACPGSEPHLPDEEVESPEDTHE